MDEARAEQDEKDGQSDPDEELQPEITEEELDEIILEVKLFTLKLFRYF